MGHGTYLFESATAANVDYRWASRTPGTTNEKGTPMQVEPQQEHQWLHQLLGDWIFETEATMEPGKPPEKFTGSESVRSLGGVWVLCEGRGEMPGGGGGTTIMTLGYDPARQRFVGTFIGSMMTHMWVYEGEL